MIRVFKRIHTFLYLGAVLFFFFLFYPVLYFFIRNPKKYYSQIVFCRKWFSLLATTAVGIRFKADYEEEIDWSKPYIICPNHTSILDITAINFLCPQPFSFMGKVELLANPVTRAFFKSIDIVVDRKSRISSFKAFKNADTLIKEGKSIVIFPEGKISDEFPPKLHEFKAGSFRLAVENGIQILPVVITNAWDILFDGGMQFGSKPGTVLLKVLKPIATKDLTDEQIDHLQTEVYNQMHNCWKANSNTNSVKLKLQKTNKTS